MSMETGHPILCSTTRELTCIVPGDRGHPRHLPPQPTRLIDREEELARLGALLAREESAC